MTRKRRSGKKKQPTSSPAPPEIVKEQQDEYQLGRPREKQRGKKSGKRKRRDEDDHHDKPLEMGEQKALIFPDVVDTTLHRPKLQEDESNHEGGQVESIFFELANATHVGFRLPNVVDKDVDGKTCSAAVVVVRQDVDACQHHTGGIVWETSFLLASFLLLRSGRPLGKTLEVGAGCGMLGLVMAAYAGLCESVVLTETSEALANLQHNVQAYQKQQAKAQECSSLQHELRQEKKQRSASPENKGNNNPTDNHDGSWEKEPCCSQKKNPLFSAKSQSSSASSSASCPVAACQLRWDQAEEDLAAAAAHHSHFFPHGCEWDTIVGTDVIFRPNLVAPLLQTIRRTSHPRTTTWLCVQVRCADSHALLWRIAADWELQVEDATSEFVQTLQHYASPAVAAAAASLECKLLRLTRISTAKEPS